MLTEHERREFEEMERRGEESHQKGQILKCQTTVMTGYVGEVDLVSKTGRVVGPFASVAAAEGFRRSVEPGRLRWMLDQSRICPSMIVLDNWVPVA